MCKKINCSWKKKNQNKGNVTLDIFWNFAMSAVIYKQRFLHKNEVVQCLQNKKYQEVNQSNFRKPLQTSANAIRNNYPKTAHTFFIGLSILSYLLRLNVITLALLWQNHSNYLHFSLSKQRKIHIPSPQPSKK